MVRFQIGKGTSNVQGYYTLSGQLVITIFNGLELRTAVKEVQLNHLAAKKMFRTPVRILSGRFMKR